MRLLDPVAHRLVALAECRQVGPCGRWTALRAPDGRVFAADLWTNETCALAALPEEELAPLREALQADRDAEALEEAATSRPTLCQQDDALVEAADDPYSCKAVLVVGSGGSGKSLVSREMFEGLGLKFINADRHLERFLQAQDIPLSDVGLHYGAFRAARELRDKELRQYSQQRIGLVVDLTGWEYKRVEKPVRMLRALGYDVSMVFVTTTLDTALRRNIQRGQVGGRDVPDSYIETAWYGAHRNFKAFVRLLGKANVLALDNDEDLPAARWEQDVGPALRRLALKMLNRPLRNKVGRAWIETRTTEQPAAQDPVEVVHVVEPFAESW